MLSNSFSIPTLMVQLQARYPTASLTAELVTVHQESFVVRALVQIAGTTLATGMAAATDIEQAEDRAKIRVLTALGISSFTQPQPPLYPSPTPAFSPAAAFTSSVPPARSISEEPSGSLINPLQPALTEPALQESPATPISEPLSVTTTANTPLPLAPLPPIETDRLEHEFDYQPEGYEPESYESEYGSEYESENAPPANDAPTVDPLPDTKSAVNAEALPTSPANSPESPKPASSGRGKSAKRKADTEVTPASPEDTDTGETDRSEEIAKIGLEMKRLGWTTEQGRNYLKRTYGKRSRQELDDSELMDFLRYLEVQVSPSESPF